ncbi:MAG: competence/damage-inducible protein A [Oscillospiraceae bacterium]|nr:competence/damage-inducible protein A [Oscillospiraceae bacterium]
MTAEILSVGTELLLGNIVNTDARDLAVALSGLGIDVHWQSVVGDNPARLRRALAVAAERAELIVTTGGLGPTCDDLTKQTVMDFFGLPMVRDARAEADLRAFFAGREMPENNLRQCDLPVGCTPFYNSCGTAPGCGVRTPDGHVLVLLPGPPKELNAMLLLSALPWLRQFSGAVIVSHDLMCFGMGESAIETRLRDRMNALQNPTLAPYAKEGEVRLRVTVKAATTAEAEALMAPVIAEVRETLGDIVYGMDVPSIEAVVLERLRALGKTFAAAESCTGGLLAQRVTAIPGASEAFAGGVTVYTNPVKAWLGVDPETLDRCGAVSAEVAEQLAVRVREKLGADYGLGITGLAGPGTDGVHEVGTVYVALATPDKTEVRPLALGARSDRSRVRALAVNHALDLLRRELEKNEQ